MDIATDHAHRLETNRVDNCAFIFDLRSLLIDSGFSVSAPRVSAVTLNRLQQISKLTNGAVGIVSDHEIARMQYMLGDNTNRMNLIGSHGGERRYAGGEYICDVPMKYDQALRDEVTRMCELIRGAEVMHKKLGLIVDFSRGKRYRHVLHEQLSLLCRKYPGDIQIIEGQDHWELKSARHNKGLAVSQLLQNPSFQSRKPYYFGADASAESAYLAINLQSGCSVQIGDVSANSRASHCLTDSMLLKDWMRKICETQRIPKLRKSREAGSSAAA